MSVSEIWVGFGFGQLRRLRRVCERARQDGLLAAGAEGEGGLCVCV